jgi:hypothetical protein
MPLLIRLFHASSQRLTQITLRHRSLNANRRVPIAGDADTRLFSSPLP